MANDSIIYPGTINHFRALMQRYEAEGWVSADGKHLAFWEMRQTGFEVVGLDEVSLPSPEMSLLLESAGGLSFPDRKVNVPHYEPVDATSSTRGTWRVVLLLPNDDLDKEHQACIEAYEHLQGQTLVRFLDGYDFSPCEPTEPIGAPFEGFAREIRTLIEIPAPEQVGRKGEENSALPKTLRTLEKWKKAYSIVTRLRKDYQKLYNDLKMDDPVPKMEDIIEASKAKGITYSHRQFRDIIKAGDAGLLK